MSPVHPVDALAAVSRRFGPAAAADKLRLLDAVEALPRISPARLRRLSDTLCFLRAYPDNPALLRRVTAAVDLLRRRTGTVTGGDPLGGGLVNSGLPGTANSYAYSYAVLQRLVALGADVEIDWSEVEDEYPLNLVMGNLVNPAEVRGLEDERLWAREWIEECKRDPGESDLSTLLELFARSSYDLQQQMHAFESCDLPVLYTLSRKGSAVSEIVAPTKRFHYQKRDIPRDRFPLAPRIRKPVSSFRRLPRASGRKMLDLALRCLCARNLEIYPLIYGNPEDVIVVRGEKGLEIVLGGVLPGFRTVPETLFFFLILKNGVPVAYGPASVVLGRCEMGINLFPEFRGGEVRLIYAEFMRAMRHLAGARYFYVVPYGMGVDNEDALRSGAFWFYRKMGFRPTNPEVETLARQEEAVMGRRPEHRSSRSTLKRLSRTHVYLDLDGGTERLDYGKLSRAVTRETAARFGTDRERATRSFARDLVKALEIEDYKDWGPGEKAAMRRLAPLFALVPGLGRWPRSDRRRLARAIRAQGEQSERNYLEALAGIPRLERALVSLAAAEEEGV